MSHFAVAVITAPGESFDDALAPFEEEPEDREYLEFIDETEEYRQKYMLKKNREEYKTFEEYARDYEGAEQHPETLRWGYWKNPNAKWDYWVIPGRFPNFLKTKNGTRSNREYIRDVVLIQDPVAVKELCRLWGVVVNGDPPRDEEGSNIYNKEYYIAKFGTKEVFVEYNALGIPFAYILDGKWYSAGRMGWFGMDDTDATSNKEHMEEFKKVLGNEEHKDRMITVVDCHI